MRPQGHSYLVREPYEELLWWLLMPSLLRLAGEPVLDRSAIVEMGTIVDEALASAEAAGYRIDSLLGPSAEEKSGRSPEEAEAEEEEQEREVRSVEAAGSRQPQSRKQSLPFRWKTLANLRSGTGRRVPFVPRAWDP